MHISFYKRPLVILLIIYCLLLALFLKAPKQDNFFENLEKLPLSLQGEVVSYPTYKNGKTNFILKLDKTYNNKEVVKASIEKASNVLMEKNKCIESISDVIITSEVNGNNMVSLNLFIKTLEDITEYKEVLIDDGIDS